MSEAKRGVLPSQALNQAIEDEWVSSGDYRIRPEAVQPASIDLRLGDFAWALRCSFLPDIDSAVEEKIDDLAFQRSSTASRSASSASDRTTRGR